MFPEHEPEATGTDAISPLSASHSPESPDSWQRQLASAIRCPHELLRELGLPPGEEHAAATKSFPLLVPRSFVRRMKVGDPHDPLLRQVLPLAAESTSVVGFSSDPVGDHDARQAPGLLQKYHGRALLILTGACAVHCRYCFRREYPYQDEPRRLEEWAPALEQLRSDKTVTEVLLSGGDPLMLNDERLAVLLQQVDEIEHIKRIRLHTRLPIVLPARVTEELLTTLRGLRSTAFVVVHANHANEIQADCVDALKRMTSAGLPVLNQSVLLRTINDSTAAQRDLCERLIDIGVLPYYLHQLDRVHGAAHFEAPDSAGLRIVSELAALLPGYAIPRFVREVPGATGKTPIGLESQPS